MFARLLWCSLRARRARLVLALLAVTLGVAVSISLAALALQVGDDLARTLRAAGPNFVMVPAGARWPLDLGGAEFEPPRAGLVLATGAVAKLKSTFWKNNVLEATPERTLSATIDGVPVTLAGTWFDRTIAVEDGAWSTGLTRLHPQWSVNGRWPKETAAEIAVGQAWAERRGVHVGDAVTVAHGERSARLVVTGIVRADAREEERAWTPLEQVEALGGGSGTIDRVWLSALVRAPSRTPAPDASRDPVGYERHMCTAYPDVVAEALQNSIAQSEVLPMTELVAGEGAIVGRLNLLMVLLAFAAIWLRCSACCRRARRPWSSAAPNSACCARSARPRRRSQHFCSAKRCWSRLLAAFLAMRSASRARRRFAATPSAPARRCRRCSCRSHSCWRSRSRCSAR